MQRGLRQNQKKPWKKRKRPEIRPKRLKNVPKNNRFSSIIAQNQPI
jgi:hypothetical protein